MKRFITCAGSILGLALCTASPSAAAGLKDPVLHPDRLLVLSTTDVKGKTGPCGCHVPKGGLARRAHYADSLRTSYGQVVLVDNGDFSPVEDERQDAAWFLMDVMHTLGADAVNIGERDLHFGRAFLEQRAHKAGVPAVSANLLDPGTHKPLFAPFVLEKVGGVTVGIFGLISGKGDLGPAKDSLEVADPLTTARATVALLRRQGADVVVLLSQLGTTDCEDLVSAVDGIDVAVVGHDAPLIMKGRMIKKTIACYGGDQGHYVCRTEVTLDAQRHMKSAESETVMLGPEVADKTQIGDMVKAFEDALSSKLTQAKMNDPTRATAPATGN